MTLPKVLWKWLNNSLSEENVLGWKKIAKKLPTSTKSRASQVTSTEMNGNISKTTFSRYHRPPWLAACHWSLFYFPLQQDTSHFIYTIALFENVFHTYPYEFSDAVKELFFWKQLCPPPARSSPHGRCGLFDFEVLCSVTCSFSMLNQNIFTQSDCPPPRRSTANKMVRNGCQIRDGSLSLQNSPGELTAWFQLVLMPYGKNSIEG